MSDPYQDPRYRQSGHSQTPYSNPQGQPDQYITGTGILPPQTTQNAYQNYPSQQHAYSTPTYTQGSQHPQQSGHPSSYPPYGGEQMPFPEPPRGQGSHFPTSTGHPVATSYSTGMNQTASVASHSGTDPYAPRLGVSLSGSSYPPTNAQTQDWNAINRYDDDVGSHDQDTNEKAPRGSPAAGYRPVCRFPQCRNPTFFDRRVNHFREWCSEQHMLAAIQYNVEKPCKQCRVWPRRNGYRYCSGEGCGYHA